MLTKNSGQPSAFKRFLESDLMWKFLHSPAAIISFVICAGLLLSAFFASWIAPYDPFDLTSFDLSDAFLPPAWMEGGKWQFLLGTRRSRKRSAFSHFVRASGFLRDRVIFSLYFCRAGCVSRFDFRICGGVTDAVIMRFCDVMLSFPAILLALLIDGIIRVILPESMHDQAAYGVLIFAISLSGWVRYARTVRGATLSEKKRDYVQAAKLFGVSPTRIMFTHILPNVLGPVLVLATVQVALAIITEATLSFLGVGVPPTTPSLGTLIRIGNEFLFSGEWWITIFPGVALILFVLSVNMLGDWLRDALNPKLQ